MKNAFRLTAFLSSIIAAIILLQTPSLAYAEDKEPTSYGGCVGHNPPKTITPKPLSYEMPNLSFADSRLGRTEPFVTTLKISADETGKILGAVVVESSGLLSWDTGSAEAVQRWKFSPGLIDGKPAAMCFLFRMVAEPNANRLNDQHKH